MNNLHRYYHTCSLMTSGNNIYLTLTLCLRQIWWSCFQCLCNWESFARAQGQCAYQYHMSHYPPPGWTTGTDYFRTGIWLLLNLNIVYCKVTLYVSNPQGKVCHTYWMLFKQISTLPYYITSMYIACIYIYWGWFSILINTCSMC